MKYIWISALVIAIVGVLWWKKEVITKTFQKKYKNDDDLNKVVPPSTNNEKVITQVACNDNNVSVHRFVLPLKELENRNLQVEKIKQLFQENIKKAKTKGYWQGEKEKDIVFWVEKKAGIFIDVGLKSLKIKFEKDCWDSMPFE